MGQNLAEKIGELAGLASEDKEVIAYGLEYLLNSTIGIVLSLLIGLILGLFPETLAVLLCWGLLRIFAGGAHCTAIWRCAVVSCIGILVVVLIAREMIILLPTPTWVAPCVAWALLAVWLWAPSNNARPVKDPQRRRRLRQRALILVPAAGILLLYLANVGTVQVQSVAVAGATGLAAGALMLSPTAFRFISRCDENLEFIYSNLRKGGEVP